MKKIEAARNRAVSPMKASGARQPEKLGRLIEYFETVRQEGLTGYIKIHFNQGNLCKVEKYEEILRK